MNFIVCAVNGNQLLLEIIVCTTDKKRLYVCHDSGDFKEFQFKMLQVRWYRAKAFVVRADSSLCHVRFCCGWI